MALSPSQRVTLLKEIGIRLAWEEWPLIDLTLAEFGLPIRDNWSGDKSSYVLQMAVSASDDVLSSLAKHLEFEFTFSNEDPIETENSCWREGTLRVFVSHLSANRALAADLQQKLSGFGISCFVAHNDIEPTKEWQREIEAALASCDALQNNSQISGSFNVPGRIRALLQDRGATAL
jgi:hypothetical protein